MRKHKIFITIITTREAAAEIMKGRKKISLISFIGIHVKATHQHSNNLVHSLCYLGTVLHYIQTN